MKNSIKNVVGLILVSAAMLPLSGFAAGKLQETELHYVRNDLERMNTCSGFAEIALQRSTNPLVKAFAQRVIDNHNTWVASLNAAMAPYDDEIHPSKNGGGAAAPAASTGMAAGAAPAGGMAAAGAPPAGGMAAGGAAATEATGPAVFAKAIKAELGGLSGDALDKMFLLRVIQYHEDIQRRTSTEMRVPGANADILKWINENLPKIEADTAIAQRIVLGQMTTLEQLAKGR
ncbi:MAG: DUF4142 domain-containing protein [Steroidobacteraceae bacterium]